MCSMHVFLALVRVLDIWQLEGRNGAQVAARSIHHIAKTCLDRANNEAAASTFQHKQTPWLHQGSLTERCHANMNIVS